MTNKEIAASFSLLGNLMELHDENPFKTKSYQFAYRNIRNAQNPIEEMSPEDIHSIPGIGKNIAEKISELLSTGMIQALEELLEKTPVGIVEMLGIKGVGPKKIKLIWRELEIDNVGELLYAVNENRLIELKGFGPKIQQSIKEQLEYFMESKGRYHYAAMEGAALSLLDHLRDALPDDEVELVGEVKRKAQIVEYIDLLTTSQIDEESLVDILDIDDIHFNGEIIIYQNFEVNINRVSFDDYFDELIKLTCHPEFYDAFDFQESGAQSEEEIYREANLPYLIPELLEPENIPYVSNLDVDQIVTDNDIKGVVHNHTVYSDGAYSVKQMAQACIDKGYKYLVITDHSKAAFYANGLSEERLLAQIEEIKKLNEELDNFTIYSGIESDILSNGDLDYDPDILDQLDVVIASVHSNLKMDEAKATKRIIKAIENPNTHILGHPTGRLLLSRKAYPLDHNKIIDACRANNVCIEINANPYRLDIDWRYIQKCMENGVLLSINPDAHSIKGIDDIHYGVCVARKGGLTKEMCLNTKDVDAFNQWLGVK